jgi:hypothetical protein
MADADQLPRRSIKAVVEAVEQVRLAILEVTPNRVRTEVGELDHGGQPAIDEERRFDQPADPAVRRASRMVLPRELRQAPRRRLVLILYDEAHVDRLSLQIVVKARHHLLECVLQDAIFIPGIRGLPLSVRKDHGVAPAPDLVRGRAKDIQALTCVR